MSKAFNVPVTFTERDFMDKSYDEVEAFIASLLGAVESCVRDIIRTEKRKQNHV